MLRMFFVAWFEVPRSLFRIENTKDPLGPGLWARQDHKDPCRQQNVGCNQDGSEDGGHASAVGACAGLLVQRIPL